MFSLTLCADIINMSDPLCVGLSVQLSPDCETESNRNTLEIHFTSLLHRGNFIYIVR